MVHLYAALAEKDEVEHFRRMDRFRRIAGFPGRSEDLALDTPVRWIGVAGRERAAHTRPLGSIVWGLTMGSAMRAVNGPEPN
jgi:hypothetical protein